MLNAHPPYAAELHKVSIVVYKFLFNTLGGAIDKTNPPQHSNSILFKSVVCCFNKSVEIDTFLVLAAHIEIEKQHNHSLANFTPGYRLHKV